MSAACGQSSRSRERGAALFVVVLAVTLLTGIGLYTVHSASLSARAAGSGREALQTSHISELNGLAMLSQLRVEARPYIQEAVNADPSFPCEMNHGLAGSTCHQLTSAELAPPTGAALLATDSFGPLGTLTGKARIEITEVNELRVPMAGFDASKEELRFYQATATVIGSLNPAGIGASACVENMMQVTGQHMLRAHLLLGPMPKVWKQAGL